MGYIDFEAGSGLAKSIKKIGDDVLDNVEESSRKSGEVLKKLKMP